MFVSGKIHKHTRVGDCVQYEDCCRSGNQSMGTRQCEQGFTLIILVSQNYFNLNLSLLIQTHALSSGNFFSFCLFCKNFSSPIFSFLFEVFSHEEWYQSQFPHKDGYHAFWLFTAMVKLFVIMVCLQLSGNSSLILPCWSTKFTFQDYGFELQSKVWSSWTNI